MLGFGLHVAIQSTKSRFFKAFSKRKPSFVGRL